MGETNDLLRQRMIRFVPSVMELLVVIAIVAIALGIVLGAIETIPEVLRPFWRRSADAASDGVVQCLEPPLRTTPANRHERSRQATLCNKLLAWPKREARGPARDSLADQRNDPGLP